MQWPTVVAVEMKKKNWICKMSRRKNPPATNFHYSYSTYFHKAFDPNQQDSMTNRMSVYMLRTGGRGEQLRKERTQKWLKFETK